MDHDTAYERVVAVGLLEADTAESLRALYRTNRTEHYYGGRVPTTAKEEAMYDLAVAVHEYASAQIRGNSVCIC